MWQLFNIPFLDFIKSLFPVCLQNMPLDSAIEDNDFTSSKQSGKHSDRMGRDSIHRDECLRGTNFTCGQFINEHFCIMRTSVPPCNPWDCKAWDSECSGNKGTQIWKATVITEVFLSLGTRKVPQGTSSS